MCGRYIIVSKLEKFEKRFNATAVNPELFTISANVSPGDYAPVITSDDSHRIEFFRFGLQPFWAKKNMYLINARSEGDFNAENDIRYHGQLGIRTKPSFRKPFRSQRCLVLADAFIEGTMKEKLSKPYVVYPIEKNERPFSMAGLFDTWTDQSTGEIINSFTIITQTAGPLLRKIPHHRSPVILQSQEEEKIWLDKESEISDVELLLRPVEVNNLNAYPISDEIKSVSKKALDLLKPKGERIIKEFDYLLHSDLELFGMGITSSRKRRLEDDSK